MKYFKDKTVLVTGASSGIGVEFARQLAAAGANLVLTARNESALRHLAQEVAEQHGTDTHIFPSDLSKPKGPQQLYAAAQQSGARMDVVVNNAGFGFWGRFEDADDATYQAMCNLNINAVVSLTHLFLPGMLERGDGGFLNVASTAAFQPIPYFATYSATKAFVLSFSEALSVEYRPHGLTITCLCPGGTATNFHEVSKMDEDKLVSMESPEKVARIGLDAFLSGRQTVISGVRNYLLANSCRFAPRSLVPKVTAAMFKP